MLTLKKVIFQIYKFLAKFLGKYETVDEALMVFDKVIQLNFLDLERYNKKGYYSIYILVKFLEKYKKIDEAFMVFD